MEYTKVAFRLTNTEAYQQDLLIDALGELGFDTFHDVQGGFEAFILSNVFSEADLCTMLEAYDDIDLSYTISEVPQENWNEEWEKNFSPMVVADQCYVRATFHAPRPEFPYEIVIDPKMAFGTGHHQTTTMMMEYILETSLTGQTALDMGCGTGILAFLASKCGAASVVAIDYDPLSYESTLENAALNGVGNVEAICGGKEVIPDTVFDVIFANINRNILLDHIPRYAEVLRAGGKIFYSGFYEEADLAIITEANKTVGIDYLGHKTMGDWCAAAFEKNG